MYGWLYHEVPYQNQEPRGYHKIQGIYHTRCFLCGKVSEVTCMSYSFVTNDEYLLYLVILLLVQVSCDFVCFTFIVSSCALQ